MKTKSAAKILLFTLILLNLLHLAGKLLYPENQITAMWRDFYQQPPASIDVLFVGSSHSYSTYDPEVFSGRLGLTSFHLATSSQTVTQAYYNVKEGLRYQSPQLVVLDAFSINDNNNFQEGSGTAFVLGSDNDWSPNDRDWKKESNIDGMRWSTNKLLALINQYHAKNYFYAAFPLYRTHSNWSDWALLKSNIHSLSPAASIDGSPAGFRPSQTQLSGHTIQQYQELEYNHTDTMVIAGTNVAHFNRLADLCAQNNIRLVVSMSPMYNGYIEKINYASWHNAVSDLAEQKQVEFIDFNYLYHDLGLDASCFEDAFNHYHHTNKKGAAIVSRALTELL